MAGRKFGDKFSNGSNTLIFDNIKFFPESGKYQTLNYPSDVIWLNKPEHMYAYAIITFTDGTKYGRFLKQIKPIFTDNYVDNTFDGYRLSSKVVDKSLAKLGPNDLLETFRLSSDDIISQLESKVDIRLIEFAKHIIRSDDPCEIIPCTSYSAFRDYYCEIMHPLWLAKNHPGSIIEFNSSKNSVLYDSMLHTVTTSLKISSKSNQSPAAASIKNILHLIEKSCDKDTSTVIEMLQIMLNAGYEHAPLDMAMKLNLLSLDEKKIILEMKGLYVDIDCYKFNNRLDNVMQSRVTINRKNVNVYYHMIASFATMVVNAVNKSNHFSDIAKKALTECGLIQVYTMTREFKDRWIFDGFKIVKPSECNRIELYSNKNYSSKDIKGNFSFKIT